MTAERSHALLGGSSAHRWTNCPGSCFYIKDLPPEEPSEHAIQGTRQHDICEKHLKDFLEYKMTGEGDPEIGALLSATDEELLIAQFYRDAVWKSVLEESITGKAFGFEDQFTLDSTLEMSGYVDFWCVHIDERAKRVLSIVDFKNGMHEVSVEKNAQLAFYAVSARQEFQNHGKDIDKVKAYIIQPKSRTPIKSTEYTPKELDTWKKKFFDAANIIFVEKKPKFKTGEWCFFCPAKGICTTYCKALTSKTALKLVEPETEILPAPERLSDEQILKVVEHYDQIKEFIDAVYAHALQRYKSGKPIKGLKAVEGATRRKWSDYDIADVALEFKKFGIDATELKLKGITVLEKLAKKCEDKKVMDLFEAFTERTKASLTLVPEADERPRVANNLDLLD